MKMTDVYVEWTFSKENALSVLDMLTNEAKEVLGNIHNLHIAALGAKTQEESIQLEQSADESREWFNWLKISMMSLTPPKTGRKSFLRNGRITSIK